MRDHWTYYALAWFMFLTWPLWKPPTHDMMACRDWKPIDAGLGPCATSAAIHKKRQEEWQRLHGAVA